VLLASSDAADQVESDVASSDATIWQVLAGLGVIVVAYPVGRLVQRLVKRAFRKAPDVPEIIVNDLGRFARWFVYLIAFAVALALIGVDIGWVALSVFVILVVLIMMLRPVLENMAAGLVLTVRPAFTLGDQIEVLDERGVVLQIGSHSTALKSVDGIRIHIPNVSMVGQKINVYSAFDSRRSGFEVSLAAGTDVAAALDTITKAVASADGVASDPAAKASATRFDQDAMIVTARFWYPSSMTTDVIVKDAAIEAVRAALAEAGIEPGGPTTGLDVATDANSPTSSDQSPKQSDSS
jgi:small-conductance mechanosensitive channel